MSDTNGALTRAQIIEANKRRIVRVKVPEWEAGHAYIRTLTVAERLAALRAGDNCVHEDAKGYYTWATLFVYGVCDADGVPLFDCKKLDKEVAVLLESCDPTAVWVRIAGAVAELNKLTEEAQAELVKNLNAGLRSVSLTTSGSRSTRRSKKSTKCRAKSTPAGRRSSR